MVYCILMVWLHLAVFMIGLVSHAFLLEITAQSHITSDDAAWVPSTTAAVNSVTGGMLKLITMAIADMQVPSSYALALMVATWMIGWTVVNVCTQLCVCRRAPRRTGQCLLSATQ